MYWYLSHLSQPYLLAFVVTGAAVANQWRRRHATPRRPLVLTVSFALLTLLSMPWAGCLAYRSLAFRYPPLGARPAAADAIVVLAGGVLEADDSHPSAELAPNSLFRCQAALDLYRDGPACPVVVCGGKVDADEAAPAVAWLMHDVLVQSGVAPADIVVEDRSTTTYENAVECKRKLAEHGWSRVVLVTEARHMLRAVGCFTAQGIDVTPAPCHPQGTRFQLDLFTFLPSAGAAREIGAVCHEWLGIVWYRLRGRM